jgi:translation initiation factor IF-2
MSGKMRITTMASELNLSKDTIIQYLELKGFKIENKATTMLSDEMIDVLYDKFKKEKKIAEKQREKFDKLKEGRKVPETKKSNVEKETTAPPPVEPFIQDLKPIVPKEPKIRQTSELDFELIEEFVEKPKIKKQPKEDKPIQEAVVIEELPAPKKATEQPVASEEIKPAEPVQQRESKPAPDVFKKDDFRKKDTELRQAGRPQDTKPAEQKPQPQDPNADQQKSKSIKKKKKRRKVAEVELGQGKEKGRSELKIVGRVDLSQFDRSIRKPKPAPPKEGAAAPKPSDDSKNKEKYKKKLKGARTTKDFDPFTDKVGDKKKKKKKTIRETISEEEITRAIRETLSGSGESVAASRMKIKMKKKAEREEKEQKILEEKMRDEKVLKLTEFVTTSDLAAQIGCNPNEIITKCFTLGLMVTINQRLDKDTIILIADDYHLDVEFIDEKAAQMMEDNETDPEDTLKSRPPIVTIMGHVDHGKTSLLDFIRKANVVAGESGGITQHIGAYQVELHNKKHITFLDTPGHEAFTAMRARGALVTDIVILVVAADDSVMPQTIEAISHAQAANVPIVVAINKIDKVDSNPDRIKQQLSDYNVLVEDWGGKNQSIELSAKKGTNVEILLEKILLEAEMLDLKANPDRLAKGTIIESNMDKGLGPVSTVIVQKGTLRIGDYFVAGTHWGRVRAMFDERGNKVEIAGPSMPVRVIGFDGLSEAGDLLYCVEAEYIAKEIANDRNRLKRQQEFKHTKNLTLDQLSKQIQEGGIKDLNLIIKADVGGSVEALSDSLFKLSTSEVRVNILHKGIGSINESDVMLAVASGAVVIGFHVNPTGAARRLADNNAIDIRLYSIIYDCINEVRLALEGLLTPDIKEEVTSTVEIRKTFKISKVGTIAGCYVTNGKISRNDKVRVLRDGLPIFTGSLDTLKRGKDDSKEVESGFECGIMLAGFNNIEIGDIIESFKIVEIKRKLI